MEKTNIMTVLHTFNFCNILLSKYPSSNSATSGKFFKLDATKVSPKLNREGTFGLSLSVASVRSRALDISTPVS